jgi:hypothetical protein
VAIAVVVVALVLVGRDRSPMTPGPPPGAAVPAAARPLTSILAVLRRPPTVADHNHVLLQMLRREQNPKTLAVLGRPVLSLLRLATIAPWGAKIYLVPFLPPTAGAKRRLPGQDRGVTTPDTATLTSFPATGVSGGRAEIEGGRVIGNMAYDARGDSAQARARWVMVVPDGVAKVAIWQLGTASTQPTTKPIVATVHNNVAAFVAPSLTKPGKELWYGPNGNIVKHIHNASSCAPPLGSCH